MTASALADVIGTESGFSALCRQLDPDSVPLPDAPAMLASLANIEKLAAGARVRLARRAEASGQWRRDGYKSFPEWLARTTGTSTGEAQSSLETSKQITDQPDTDAALRNGDLSENQANTVSDAAKANPSAERDLVNKAKTSSVKDLREEAGKAKARADQDPEATHRRQHANRSCRTWTDSEGLFNLLVRNTPEVGAELKAILEPFLNHVFTQARHAGRHESRGAYAADALIDIFRTATGVATGTAQAPSARDGATSPSRRPAAPPADPAGPAGTAGQANAAGPAAPPSSAPPPDQQGTDHHASTAPSAQSGDHPGCGCAPDARPDADRPPKNGSLRPDSKVIAFLDWQALIRGHRDGDETCEIAGLGAVPVSSVRAMLGDATLALVIRNGVDVVHVTHLGRAVTAHHRTAHHRTALEARRYQCCVPGCGSTFRLEIDHVNGWAVTHKTELHDLDWLCHHHHHQKTHGGYRITGPPGQRTWHHPDGAVDRPEPATWPPSPRPPQPPPHRCEG